MIRSVNINMETPWKHQGVSNTILSRGFHVFANWKNYFTIGDATVCNTRYTP